MKILLPIDDSTCSRDTIKWAAKTFDKNNSYYYLLFVIPSMPPDVSILAFDNIESLNILNKAKAELESLGCIVESTDYRMGDAVLEICDYADAYDIDQVVIGTHGRSGLAKMISKSIGEGVLEHCRRPVVVFRDVEKPLKLSASTKPHPAFSNELF